MTDSPTAAWTARQIIEVFPDDSAPRHLLLGISAGTVKREWAKARAWLRRELQQGQPE